jgi:hypothetical protein
MNGIPDGFVLDQPAAPTLPPGFVIDQPSTVEDVAKSGGAGLLHGVIGASGMMGDLREAGVAGANYLAKKLTGSDMSPEARAALDTAIRYSPGPFLGQQSSAEIRGQYKDATGSPVPDYAPQTEAGKLAQTVGEFAPAALGPGGAIRRVAQVVLPALASEGAGALTEGTAAEPYAKTGAAIAASIAAHKLTSPKALPAITPTSDDLLDAARQGYQSPTVKNVAFKTGVVDDIASKITGDLDNLRLNDRRAPMTRGIVEDLASPINGAAHSMEDYSTTRELLGKVAGNYANPIEQGAASQAISRLDKYFGGIKQNDLVSGDIAAANDAMTQARQNYALGKLAQRVEGGIDRAELNAASAHSGGNINNTTRQALKPMLLSPSRARGLSADDLANIENVVTGSPTGNALRVAGKLLGGGGGLGAVTAGVVGHALVPGVGVAAPAVGYAIKKAGDALTRRAAQNVVDQIIARSPEAKSFASRQAAMAANQPNNPSLGYLGNGMLSGMIAARGAGALPAPSSLPFSLAPFAGQR